MPGVGWRIFNRVIRRACAEAPYLGHYYPPAIETLNAKQEVDEVPIPLEDESMDDAALRDVPISRSTR